MQIKPPARYQRIGWRRDRFRLNGLVTDALTFRIRLVERPASSGDAAASCGRARWRPAAAFCRDPGWRSLTGLIRYETMHCELEVAAEGRVALHRLGRVHCFGAAAALRVSTDRVWGSLSQPGCHSRGCRLV